ncbi:MAG: alkaline phosphatase family protein [Thioalkalivibrio sp.]
MYDSDTPLTIPLQEGWSAPDYGGNGIANLMSSLCQGLGDPASTHGCPPLHLLPPASVREASQVLLLVVDGLGEAMVRDAARCPTLRRHQVATLSSVFPTTTAAGITCYLTGHPPARHGLTGWHVYLEGLDTVMAVLPGLPRGPGPSYADLSLTPRELLGLDPLFSRLGVNSACVSPESIANSLFNLSVTHAAHNYVYQDLPGFFAQARHAVHEGARFTYAYWPELDHLGHLHGADSTPLREHLGELDTGFAHLLETLAGSDTLVLLSADHGMIDAPLQLDLNDHPQIMDCLRLPLCGEPRAAFVYVKPDCQGRFEQLVNQHLGHCVTLVHSRALLDAGWFGPAPHHPRLAGRVGDFTLLMHDGWMVIDPRPGEALPAMVAVHGGLSAAERQVPLVMARV